MRVRLRYGSTGLTLSVPRGATVLQPTRTPPLADPGGAVRAALALVDPARLRPGRGGRRRAAIVVADVTRLMPNAVVLGPLLDLLAQHGLDRDDVTLVIATGLHRASRPAERERILGPLLARRYRVVDHVARDPATLAYLGTTARGTRVEINRDYLEADVRVLTGFVEPHLFAGYSGGGKAVLPGIASAAAVLANHGADMIGHPQATFCVTAGNPIFEEIREVALHSEPALVVNVTLDERRRLTGVFAGDLVAAHDAAIAQAARQARQPVPHRFDVVVATNMGYPADLVLYQSVKGLALARLCCEPGGAILLCAECREGVGGAEYEALLRSHRAPAALLRRLRRAPRTIIDQWQVQIQAQVQTEHEVHLYSALPPRVVEEAHLRYAADPSAALAAIIADRRDALGREPRVCVLPHGQLTVPVVAAGAGASPRPA
ncbi:MAG: nickel-dependent lactate racemase [Deltaproteobacteria bacterium]|nr:nickel-dependent lactate racemase [Deltaproteobacteria bacterium]